MHITDMHEVKQGSYVIDVCH